MSVLYQKKCYSFIDHGHFINNLYREVCEKDIITSYELSKNMFSIITESKKKHQSRKRRHESEHNEEVSLV